MNNIDRIITEAINDFLEENILDESKKNSGKHSMDDAIKDVLTHKKHLKGGKAKKKKLKDIVKKGKKLRNGRRTDFDAKKERETNPNLTNQDAEDINNILDSDYINVAALAQDVYPDHTPEGAQSQLRKKIKGLTNDTGSKYKLKKKEAYKIRRYLSRELNK